MSATNFATLYGPAAKSWNLPAPDRLDREAGSFRGLRLNWTTLDTERRKPPLWLLCCDVLVIERDLTIDGAVFVFARRIELKKGRSITLDRTDGNAADLLIFAQEVVDADTGSPTALSVTSVSGDGATGGEPEITEHPFKPDPDSAATGLDWPARGKPASMEPARLDPGFLLMGEPLRLSLVTTFQVATLLSSEDPDVSIAQSRWVGAMATASQDTADLSVQALAMAGTLLSMKAAGAALLVPRLDAEIYADKSKAMMDVLQERDRRFRELQSEHRSDENWQLQAQSVLSEQRNQGDLHQQLEKQGEEARAQAMYARAIAVGQVLYAQEEIRDCEMEFELGIKKWQHDKTLDEEANIALGVFDILKAIPAIAAGAPQLAVLPAVETATGAAKAVAGIVNTMISTAPRVFNSLLDSKSGSPSTPNAPAPSPTARTSHSFFDDDDWPDRSSGGSGGGILITDSDNDDDSGSDDDGGPINLVPEGYDGGLDPVSPGGGSGTSPSTGSTATSTTGGGSGIATGGTATGTTGSGSGAATGGTATGTTGGGSGSGAVAGSATVAAGDKEKERKAQLDKLQSQMIDGLAKAGEGAKKIFDAAMNIVAIAEKARKMEATSREILDISDQTIKKGFASSVLQGLDVVTGGQQEWDTLEVEVKYIFEKFRDGLLQQVSGGPQYQRAYQRLLVRTRSLSQCRLAVAKANMQLAELRLRRITAERSVGIAQRRLGEIKERAARIEMLAQFVFNTTLDSKRAVYLAMEAHNRAYLYFTLADAAPTLPRITDSVDAFGKTVAEIVGKQLRREALDPAPQTMQEIVCAVNSQSVIDGLRSSGCATWTVGTANRAFEGFGRVRIERIRVQVEGARSNVPIEVQIQTAGLYADKVPRGGTHQLKQFVSQPTRRTFVYNPNWTGEGDRGIVVDGDIARRYKDDFFNPTPFTTFTIRVVGRNGGTVDLSGVTGLKVYFSGEVTATSVH